MSDAPETHNVDDAWTHIARVREMNVIGRHDLALQYAEKGLAQHAGDPFLELQMAIALFSLGRKPEAERITREAAGHDPDANTGALTFLAVILMDRGCNREAEQCLIDALKQDPEDAHAWLQYGRLMSRVGRFAKARELLERARSLDPEDSDTLQLLAEIERDEERSLQSQSAGDRRAAAASKKALAQAPDDPGALVEHALSCLASGRPFTARRLLREALAAHPSEGLESAWLEADKVCRWTFQPVYWLNVLARRLPGGTSTLWIVFAGYGIVLRTMKVQSPLAFVPLVAFVVLALYSWVADPVTRLWIRMVPSR
ncbi:MAG TPA: tetratricopeptide repeat protein [Planctomycetota bacterium]